MSRLPVLILFSLLSSYVFGENDTLAGSRYALTLELVRNALANGDPEHAKKLMDPLILELKPDEIRDSGLIADIFFLEGNVLLSLSDPPGAVKAYREGRQYAVDPLQVSRIDQNLGAAFFLMDDFEKSVLYLDHSFLTLVHGGYYAPQRLMAICQNLGSAWFESGDYDKAETWWKEAGRLRKEFFPDDLVSESGIIAARGNIHFRRHEWIKASASFRESLELLDKSGMNGGQEYALLLRNLALTLRNEGNTDSAMACLRKAENLLVVNGQGNTILMAELCRAEGEVLLQEKNFAGAREAFDRGLVLLSPREGSFLAEYERFRLKRDKAFGFYHEPDRPTSKALFPLDSLFIDLLSAIDCYRALCRISGEHQIAPASDSAALLYHRAIETGYKLFTEQGYPCFQILPGLFSECKTGLESYGGSSRLITSEVPDTIAELANLLDRRLFYYHRLSLQDPNSLGLPDASREEDIFRLTLERDSLTACYPAISKHRSGEPEVSINPRRIQSALAPGEVLLDYVISGAYMYTLACTCDTCVIYRSPEAEKCLEEFSDSENALNSADLERFIPMARDLSGKLFGPASELWRGASRLIIIPDPAFGSLPFECLTVPGMQEHGPAPYLVSRFSISYQCSLSGFLTSRLHAPGMKRKRYSWFGCAPTFDSREGLADLQFTRDEVRSVSALFQSAGKSILEVEGTQADENAFLQGSPSAEIIHISSHAKADPLHSELSGVFLWKDDPVKYHDPLIDGILELGELGTLKLDCDLLVLSSCSLSGDASLAGQVMNAGAENVLFSLWNVPDRYTSDLMTGFYRYYLSGSSYPEALRKAKVDLLNNPKTSNPFIWGGFVLYGSE